MDGKVGGPAYSGVSGSSSLEDSAVRSDGKQQGPHRVGKLPEGRSVEVVPRPQTSPLSRSNSTASDSDSESAIQEFTVQGAKAQAVPLASLPELQGQLDAYGRLVQAQVPRLDTPSGRRQMGEQLKTAMAMLQNLERGMLAQLARKDASDKKALLQQKNHVTQELKRLTTFNDEFLQATREGTLPRFTRNPTLDELLALAIEGVPLPRMPGELTDIESASAGDTKGRPPPHERARAQLGPEIRKLYETHKIPMTALSTDVELLPQTQVGELTRLSQGAFNTTWNVKFQRNGELVEAVFKPIVDPKTRKVGAVEHAIGISRENPQFIERNLASFAIARAIGFDVVVPTRIGFVMPLGSDPDDSPVPGLVMDKAGGTTAANSPKWYFENKHARQLMLRLQLVDHLLAQGDRHGNNYFLQPLFQTTGPTLFRLWGIDNDQCLGETALNAGDISRSDGKSGVRHGMKGTDLPPALDEETAQLMEDFLSSGKLAAILTELKLPDHAIWAAVSRMYDLQVHIRSLREKGRVVPLDSLIDLPKGVAFDATNSYIGREMANATSF